MPFPLDSDPLDSDPLDSHQLSEVALTAEPGPQNGYHTAHVERLLTSFRRLLGRDLIDPSLSQVERARQLFEAPFAVVSHNAPSVPGEEPVFNYGNRIALELFAMSWERFIQLPSRLSAEPLHQAERARLFERVRSHGYIDDYRGIRIASTGRRFKIENAIVWTLYDETGQRYGEAAMFAEWVDVG